MITQLIYICRKLVLFFWLTDVLFWPIWCIYRSLLGVAWATKVRWWRDWNWGPFSWTIPPPPSPFWGRYLIIFSIKSSGSLKISRHLDVFGSRAYTTILNRVFAQKIKFLLRFCGRFLSTWCIVREILAQIKVYFQFIWGQSKGFLQPKSPSLP